MYINTGKTVLGPGHSHQICVSIVWLIHQVHWLIYLCGFIKVLQTSMHSRFRVTIHTDTNAIVKNYIKLWK